MAEWYFSAPAADCRHWKKQTVGTVGDMRQRVAQHLPGLLGDVHRLPVDSVCGVLHEEPGRSAGDVARETRGEGQLVQALRTRQHIVVVRDEVHLVSPVGVVPVSYTHL